MKTVGTILKVFAALAAVAGAIYVVVTYGDKIVAWVKKVFRIPEKCCCGCRDEQQCIEYLFLSWKTVHGCKCGC